MIYKTEVSMPLLEFTTLHSARKTFITNIKALKDMCASKKEKDMKKYLKITDAFKSLFMDYAWNVLSLNHIPKGLINQY
jgi:hypothetical protein